MNIKLISTLPLVLLLILAISTTAAQNRPQETRPPQERSGADKPVESPDQEASESQEALRRAIEALTHQIGSLSLEIQKLRLDGERTSQMTQLLLFEERLMRTERALEQVQQERVELESRDQQLQIRLRNVPQEAAIRGGRREDVEAALRADIQRALDVTRDHIGETQARIYELQSQAEVLKSRIEKLRKILEPDEEKDN